MNKTRGFDHSGSTFDSFLEEEGILEETEALAIKRVIAWQLKQAMKEKHITKYAMAKRLHTSRSQVDRLLHPDNIGVTIGTLSKAAKVVGKRIALEVVERPPANPSGHNYKEGQAASCGASNRPQSAPHASQDFLAGRDNSAVAKVGTKQRSWLATTGALCCPASRTQAG